MRLRRRRGDVSPIGQGFLACCYALIGFSVAGAIVLRWTGRRIDEAMRLPAPAQTPAPAVRLRAVQ